MPVVEKVSKNISVERHYWKKIFFYVFCCKKKSFRVLSIIVSAHHLPQRVSVVERKYVEVDKICIYCS